MRHNISIYDTAPSGSYSHRGEGFIMASMIVGLIGGVTGLVMFFAGIYDPTVPASAAVFGGAAVLMLIAHALMFVTHRNFGLAHHSETKAMDAIYSLPKADRKRYKVSVDDLKMLTVRECEEIVSTITEYRRNNSTSNGVSRLLGDINSYNDTYREIEGKR